MLETWEGRGWLEGAVLEKVEVHWAEDNDKVYGDDCGASVANWQQVKQHGVMKVFYFQNECKSSLSVMRHGVPLSVCSKVATGYSPSRSEPDIHICSTVCD